MRKDLLLKKLLGRRNKIAAFTLLEIMIGVAIVGILSSIAVPSFNKYIYEARRSEAVVMLNNVWKAEKAYFEEHGYYRPSFSGAARDPGLPDGDGATRPLAFTPPSNPRYNLIVGRQGADPSNNYALSRYTSYEYLETSGNPQKNGLNDYGLARGTAAGGNAATNPYDPTKIIIGAEGRIGASSEKLDILFLDSSRDAQLFLLCDSTVSDIQPDTSASNIYQSITDKSPLCVASAAAGGSTGAGGTGD
jgi:type IV pilus assembly protein PilA